MMLCLLFCVLAINFNAVYLTTSINAKFPTDEFVNYVNTHRCNREHRIIDGSVFRQRYLCSSNSQSGSLLCSCDKNRCFVSRSCCIDIIWHEFAVSSANRTIEKYINRFLEEHYRRSDSRKTLSCQPAIPEQVVPQNEATRGTIERYKMVARCPDNGTTYPQNIPKASVPIQGSDGLMYTSPYVASCHKVEKYKQVALEIKTVRNSSEINIKNVFSDFYQIEIQGMDRFKCFDKGKPPICKDEEYNEFKQHFNFDYSAFTPEFSGWGTLIIFHTSNLQIKNYHRTRHTKLIYKCSKTGQQFDILKSACVNSTCPKPYRNRNLTCVLDTEDEPSFVDSYPWQRDFRSANYYISVIGTPMSICGYTWAIISFLYFKELQNLPRLNSICMTTALLFTDTFFFIGLVTPAGDMNQAFCKIQAIIIHWSSLCAMVWAILTATELANIFYTNIIIPSKINKKRFLIYVSISVLFPSVLVILTVLLDKHDVINAGYANARNICWLTRFESRLYFYIIPIGIGYLMTILALIYIIFSLSRKIASSRSVLKSSLTHGHKTTKFIVNLTLVLGVTEVLGFVQIVRPSGNYSREELLANALFSLVYVIFRSSRGVLIAYIYIFNKKTIHVLKMSFRKRFPGLLAWNCKNQRRVYAGSVSFTSAGNTASLSSSNS